MGTKESKDNNLKKLHEKYHNLVNQIMCNSLNDNYYNISNQIISLKIKDFNREINNNQNNFPFNNPIEFINWETYLLSYLSSSEYDNEWSNQLINVIKNKSFDNQYIFKSEMFYEEFKILTCPNKIFKQFDNFYKNKNNNKNNENNDYENITNNVNDNALNFNNNIINDSNKINIEKINKLNLSNYLTGSIISDYSSNNLSSIDEEKYIMVKINKYIEIFHKHLKNKNHPFNFIIKNFCIIFSNYLEDKLNIMRDLKNKNNHLEIKNNFKLIKNNIQLFIIDLQTSFKLFYSRTINYEYIKNEKDEIINLITNRIFKFPKFYENMYKLFSLYYKNKIDLLKDKLEMFNGIKPEDIGIKKIFCLNEKTEEFIKELNEDKKINDYNKNESKDNKQNNKNNSNNNNIINENIIEEINTKEIKQINDSVNEKLIISSDTSKLLKFPNENSYISSHKNTFPYENCVNFLNGIEEYKSPFEKLLIMLNINKLIKECIDEYWKQYNNLIQPSLLNIDPDDFNGIFIYIIIKCNNPNLFIHCGFVKHFTMQSSKNSIGYNYSTIVGNLKFINKKNNKEDFLK